MGDFYAVAMPYHRPVHLSLMFMAVEYIYLIQSQLFDDFLALVKDSNLFSSGFPDSNINPTTAIAVVAPPLKTPEKNLKKIGAADRRGSIYTTSSLCVFKSFVASILKYFL